MSQKFVMLFLVSKTQTVTLDAAARTLIDESQDLSSHSKYKSEWWGESPTCDTSMLRSLSELCASVFRSQGATALRHRQRADQP